MDITHLKINIIIAGAIRVRNEHSGIGVKRTCREQKTPNVKSHKCSGDVITSLSRLK